MAGRISLLRSLGSAIAFLPKGVFGALIPLSVYPALTLGMAFAPAIAAPTGENLGLWIGGFLLFWLTLMVASVMQLGALYRLALGRKGDGPLGFQFNEVEMRILGAGILMGLLLFVLMIPATALFLFSTQGLQDFAISAGRVNSSQRLAELAQPGHLGSMAGLCVAGLWCLFIWSRTRLYLAATVAENQMVVTSAWGLTSGSTLTMMLGVALITFPTWGWSLLGFFWQLDGDVVSAWTRLPISDAWLNTIAQVLCFYVLQPVLSDGFNVAAYRQATSSRPKRHPDLAEPEPEPEPAAG